MGGGEGREGRTKRRRGRGGKQGTHLIVGIKVRSLPLVVGHAHPFVLHHWVVHVPPPRL